MVKKPSLDVSTPNGNFWTLFSLDVTTLNYSTCRVVSAPDVTTLNYSTQGHYTGEKENYSTQGHFSPENQN